MSCCVIRCSDLLLQIERLCQHLEGLEQLNHEMTMEYEHQLNNVQEEVSLQKPNLILCGCGLSRSFLRSLYLQSSFKVIS